MQTDGLFRELKNRRFYEKPSLKKRKRREARKRKPKVSGWADEIGLNTRKQPSPIKKPPALAGGW